MTGFKELLDKLGIGQKEFAREIGIQYDSFRAMTTKKKLEKASPSWIKAFIFGLKIGKLRGNDEEISGDV